MKKVFALLIVLLVLIGASLSLGYWNEIHDFFASVFFVQSITINDLKTKYAAASATGRKVKILVMPGHEPGYGGAEYHDLAERDMNVELAMQLATDLNKDSRFDVVVARGETGWNSDIQNYFDTHADDIKSFVSNKKAEMNRLISLGQVTKVTDGAPHGNATTQAAFHLFGINKWADDNNIDIMIHVHFNNYPRRHPSSPGPYTGFTIYTPDAQYSNALATRAMAGNVFQQLIKVEPVSNFPPETAGIVDDQDLIAIGEGNTADGVSMLIEYAYIYEPQFATTISRSVALNSYADKTAQGVEDFFNTKLASR
jgi:N-acetylmuramoyl-L-alanine amidase